MKVFVTGATGYVGSAVASALIDGGHRVTGVGRNKALAEALENRGLVFFRGELSDTKLLTDMARNVDAVVHCAADASLHRAQVEAAAVQALMAGVKTNGKAFLYTSGIWVLGNTGSKPADETAKVNPLPLVAWRPAMEKAVLSASAGKLRTCVIRPGIVYGGNRGILSEWWASATQKRLIQIVGFGKNRWPMVHREDLGGLYRLVLEKGAAGAVYHGTDDTAHSVMELAEAAARVSGASVRALPLAEAQKKLGPFADALAADQHVVSPASRKLGWKPLHADFLAGAKQSLEEFNRG